MQYILEVHYDTGLKIHTSSSTLRSIESNRIVLISTNNGDNSHTGAIGKLKSERTHWNKQSKCHTFINRVDLTYVEDGLDEEDNVEYIVSIPVKNNN